MVVTRTQIGLWSAVIVGSIALTGYLFAPSGIVQAEPYNDGIRVAMALFGGDDQKPTTPPPKPLTPKPQTPPAQGSTKPAEPTGTGPTAAPAVQPGSAESPAQPAPPGPAAGAPPPAKPGTLTSTGGAKEPPKPSDAVVAPTIVSPSSPVTEASDGYSYDPKSRRDPFQALTKAIKKERELDVPPLQRYQLSDVKILGIVWGGYGYHALVQTPDGKGYTVKEGMLMGTNNGVIKAITDKAIVVSEPAFDFSGKKIEKEVELLLRPKEVS